MEAAQKDEDILEGLLSLYCSELGRITSLLFSTVPERKREILFTLQIKLWGVLGL